MTRALLGIALLAVLATLIRGNAPARAASPFIALGFQEQGTPASAIDRSAGSVNVVGVDGVNLIAGGAGVAAPDAATLAELAAAHRDHLPATLLVGNFSSAVNDFSEPLAHGLLGSPAHIAAVVQSLVGVVGTQGWNGVTLDLESLHARDTAGLTAFVQALRAALPSNISLSICLQNSSRAADFAASGYDLPAIGQSVDAAILMAYDDHGPWENQPGPIGPLAWQRAGLSILARSIPAAKIILGVAGYGYGWRPHSNVMVSDARARAIVRAAGARARWSATAGEWTATLSDGSTFWWSDARSLALRVAIARAQGLAGVCVWSLGLSDPITV